MAHMGAHYLEEVLEQEENKKRSGVGGTKLEVYLQMGLVAPGSFAAQIKRPVDERQESLRVSWVHGA